MYRLPFTITNRHDRGGTTALSLEASLPAGHRVHADSVSVSAAPPVHVVRSVVASTVHEETLPHSPTKISVVSDVVKLRVALRGNERSSAQVVVQGMVSDAKNVTRPFTSVVSVEKQEVSGTVTMSVIEPSEVPGVHSASHAPVPVPWLLAAILLMLAVVARGEWRRLAGAVGIIVAGYAGVDSVAVGMVAPMSAVGQVMLLGWAGWYFLGAITPEMSRGVRVVQWMVGVGCIAGSVAMFLGLVISQIL